MATSQEPADLEKGVARKCCSPQSQEDYAKKPTIIKFVEGQTGFTALLIWVFAILHFVAGASPAGQSSDFLWGGIFCALAFLNGLQVWYMYEHGDYFAKLSARLFGQNRAQLKCGLLLVFESLAIIVVFWTIEEVVEG